MADDDYEDEKTLFNVKQQCIRDIHELNGLQIKSLRIMHSPDLTSMLGIEQFKTLRHLNLAQNSLQGMSLKTLLFLETLNLQGNRIKVLNCDGLRRLHTLNLSYNLISQLQPLQIFTNSDYCLKVLDLRANCIADLAELRHIQSIPLQEVYFDTDKRKNPICSNRTMYFKQILKYNANIQLVDKIPIHEVRKQANTNVVDENNQNPPNIPPPVNQKLNKDRDIEKEAERRFELLQLQQRINELTQQQSQLIYKFECNEKYWVSRCSNFENEIVDLQKLNRELNSENKKFRKDIERLNEDIAEDKQNEKHLQQKKERKDELINQLQQRVSDLLMNNGQITKENQQLVEQIGGCRNLINEKEQKVQELKSQLKEVEKALSDFHRNAVDQVSQTLVRQESLQVKYENSMAENKQIMQETSQLKRRIQELLEICREWEVKYDSNVQEQETNLKLQLQEQGHDYEQRIHELISKQDEQLKEMEIESRMMQDQLENEFRNIITDNLDKYKQVKIAYDEKVRVESELNQMLRLSQQRLSDQESLINELQGALLRLKKEVQDYMGEKDYVKREYLSNVAQLQRELTQLEEQNQQLGHKLAQVERDLRNKVDEMQQMSQENEIMKVRLKNNAKNEQLIEEMQMNLTIKNKMLDDKNDSIEELKQQINQIKTQEGQAGDDYNRLVKRYDRQNQVIEELEGQLQQMQEEYDQKCRELKEKKQLISLFEKEVEDIRDKQDSEINNLKHELMDKDQNIVDLVKVLDEAKESIRRKEDKIRELTVQYQQIDRQLQQIQTGFEKQQSERDGRIQQLKMQLNQVQEELQSAYEENEKIKRAGRDNLQNLHKLFT